MATQTMAARLTGKYLRVALYVAVPLLAALAAYLATRTKSETAQIQSHDHSQAGTKGTANQSCWRPVTHIELE